MEQVDYFQVAKNVLNLEAQAIIRASERLRAKDIAKLTNIFTLLKNFGGNLIFSGVGKSGSIAQKISSTFCSLGLPSYFLHPVEALHGDLGRMSRSDGIVLISKSGTTEEILKLIPYLKTEKSMAIGLLGNTSSPIAEKCSLVFDCSVEKEACINNQAPTTSSTLTLAIGDAMAVVYEKIVGLSKEGFAENHPAGFLGKALHLRAKDLMCPFSQCPVLTETATLKDAIIEMTRFPVGGCAILDGDKKLLGLMVEGDIRRVFTSEENNLETPLEKLMNKSPVMIGPDCLALKALELMEKRKHQINILPIINENDVFLGFIRPHDLLREGFKFNS